VTVFVCYIDYEHDAGILMNLCLDGSDIQQGPAAQHDDLDGSTRTGCQFLRECVQAWPMTVNQHQVVAFPCKMPGIRHANNRQRPTYNGGSSSQWHGVIFLSVRNQVLMIHATHVIFQRHL
jgi:hypothetical protein